MTDVEIEYDDDNAGEHRRGKVRSNKSNQFVFDTSTKQADKLTDPVRCPMCSQLLQCPRDKDYEQFIERKNLKCLNSDDQICARAVVNPKNKSYVDRLKASKK